MSEIDVVARVSDRICEHMNLDHASAVLHLSMHHARLAQLPRWAKMEAIAATRMVIRYAERTNTAPASSDADLPTVEVLFDPPLQSTLDARERLVFLSAEAEQQNQQRAVQVGGTIDLLLTQNAPQEWCDRITLDLIVMRFNTFVTGAYASRATDTDPLTWFMLAILLTVARQPSLVTRSATVQKILLVFWDPLRLISAVVALALAVRAVDWLSCAWTNAAPVPQDRQALWLWTWRTVMRRTLPRLENAQWQTQRVVITGGASGLGAMVALRLAERGAQVIALDVIKSTVQHANICSYHCDISKLSSVASVARSIVCRHGTPTILINNAAVRNGSPLTELSNEAIEKCVVLHGEPDGRVLGVNSTGHFWMLKEFLPAMIEKKRGHVVTVSSVMGYAGIAQMGTQHLLELTLADYVATKHALVGLHESLRFELDAIHKTPFVRTTLVVPGQLRETNMFSGIQFNQFARFVAPPVSASCVADEIVSALEHQESRFIALPFYAKFAPLLRLLPSFLRDGIQLALGANHSMSTIAHKSGLEKHS